MRKCLRCHEEMVENLDVKVDMQGYGIMPYLNYYI